MRTESVPRRPNDPPAEVAFESFTKDVYAWAYRLLGQHHDALDVVQDVFLKWEGQCREESPRHARGWLRRVTFNRAIDVMRQRRGAGVTNELPCTTAAHTPRASGPEHAELREVVVAALGALTDTQRSVLVAKVYDDLTFAKIADELGLGVSTVKTHYVRAIGRLSETLRSRWTTEDLT